MGARPDDGGGIEARWRGKAHPLQVVALEGRAPIGPVSRAHGAAARTTEYGKRGEYDPSQVRLVIEEFQGMYGRVMAELIAEGQTEADLLRDLYDQHIGFRPAHVVAEIERAKADGELISQTNAEVLVDQISGAIFYRLLLRIKPLDQTWGDQLVDQAFSGLRTH